MVRQTIGIFICCVIVSDFGVKVTEVIYIQTQFEVLVLSMSMLALLRTEGALSFNPISNTTTKSRKGSRGAGLYDRNALRSRFKKDIWTV